MGSLVGREKSRMDHAVAFSVQHPQHVIHGGDVAVKLFLRAWVLAPLCRAVPLVWAVTGACICQLPSPAGHNLTIDSERKFLRINVRMAGSRF